ncbi:hypothetical protein [Telmatospirillum siberiense]|uniref:Pyridoxamine 5'-phosphate oxidase putative domain-containing protein n=1 Tax=Telmatospirillum siberiense TaxID=382514 RepID=A0A2N3PNY5_9PROT|nr:hypothetical protein [Telmatospirillum siberiense]PKU22123.1 hypothetical protein CWS72_23065 [Telmatospirillum siberiense]
MTSPLPPEVTALLDDETTVKALATVDASGVPHLEIPLALFAGGDGTIHYLEPLESSATNRNLVRSVWFDAPLAVILRAADGRTAHIRGTAIKVHVAGPLFQRHYTALRDRLGDVDLAGVWVIRPDEITWKTFDAALAREAAEHPSFIHLDRLAIH